MAVIGKPAKPALKKPAAKAAVKAKAKKSASGESAKKAPAKAVKKTKPAVKADNAKPAQKAKTVKKPPVKTAAKEAQAKKSVSKTPAKVPAEKTAAKTAVKTPKKAVLKKPVSEKPAAGVKEKKTGILKVSPKIPAVKTSKTKVPAHKPHAAPEPAAPKTAAHAPPHAGSLDSDYVYPNLFDAYNAKTLPYDRGFIITSFFKDNSAYAVFEITAYSEIKELSRIGSEIQFQCEKVKKFYVLVEPFDYSFKDTDPADRTVGDSIPYRRNELEVITAADNTQIMIAREARSTDSVFAVFKPNDRNFAAVFSKTEGVFKDIVALFSETFIHELGLSQADAEKASDRVIATLERAVS